MNVKCCICLIFVLFFAIFPAAVGNLAAADGPEDITETPAADVSAEGDNQDRQITNGSMVSFGHYEQDHNPVNGPEPIEWLVLEIDDANHKALLLSRYALREEKLSDSPAALPWHESPVNRWLNGDFLNYVFSEEEQLALVDNHGGRIFFLSRVDVEKMLPNEMRLCELPDKLSTADHGGAYVSWWLRDTYLSGDEPGAGRDGALRGIVDPDGNITGRPADAEHVFVRPAVWVELDFLKVHPSEAIPTAVFDPYEETTEIPVQTETAVLTQTAPVMEVTETVVDSSEIYSPEPTDTDISAVITESETPVPTETQVDVVLPIQTEEPPEQGQIPTSTPEPTPTPQPSVISRILSNPVILAAVGAVVIGGIGGYVVVSQTNHKDNHRKDKKVPADPEKKEPVIESGELKGEITPAVNPEITLHLRKSDQYQCAACIGQGKRNYQEDALWFSGKNVSYEPVCAVIADGMGGMDNGAESSARAIEMMQMMVLKINTDKDIPSKLWQICKTVNKDIYEMNTAKGMNGGATLICVYITDNQLYWLSVGDSRIYLCRDGMLASINEEHEVENRMYNGMMNGEIELYDVREMKESELRKLTSNLGRKNLTLFDQNYIPYNLEKGDKLLLCSDGVSGTLSEQEILQCLKDPDPNVNCSRIAEMVEQKDKRNQDNYSAVVVCLASEGGK